MTETIILIEGYNVVNYMTPDNCTDMNQHEQLTVRNTFKLAHNYYDRNDNTY